MWWRVSHSARAGRPGPPSPTAGTPFVDLLDGRWRTRTHLLGHLGVRLEGCDGGSTTGFAELPEDPEGEVGLAGGIDEGSPVLDDGLILHR